MITYEELIKTKGKTYFNRVRYLVPHSNIDLSNINESVMNFYNKFPDLFEDLWLDTVKNPSLKLLSVYHPKKGPKQVSDAFSPNNPLGSKESLKIQLGCKYKLRGEWSRVETLNTLCTLNKLEFERTADDTIVLSGKAFFGFFEAHLSKGVLLDSTEDCLFLEKVDGDTRARVENIKALEDLILYVQKEESLLSKFFSGRR